MCSRASCRSTGTARRSSSSRTGKRGFAWWTSKGWFGRSSVPADHRTSWTAAALVLLHPDLRDKAREIALAYSVDLADKLNVWLADRRLQGQIGASRASAEGEPGPGSGAGVRTQDRQRAREI